jgi:hypothetical protein
MLLFAAGTLLSTATGRRQQGPGRVDPQRTLVHHRDAQGGGGGRYLVKGDGGPEELTESNCHAHAGLLVPSQELAFTISRDNRQAQTKLELHQQLREDGSDPGAGAGGAMGG